MVGGRKSSLAETDTVTYTITYGRPVPASLDVWATVLCAGARKADPAMQAYWCHDSDREHAHVADPQALQNDVLAPS